MSNISITTAARPDTGLAPDTGINGGAAANKTSPLLAGKGVTVSAAFGDLDKLIAQLQQESDEIRLSSARQRISLASTILASLNVKLTEREMQNFAKMEELNEKIASLTRELSGEEAKLDTASVVLALKIQALEAAVKNQIKAGEDYRAAKEKADAAKNRDEATRRKAAEELAIATAKLEAANKAVEAATTAKNEAAAQKNIIATAINSLKSQISTLQDDLAVCTKAIGSHVLEKISTVLRTTAAEVAASDPAESAEDRRKEDEKEATLNPANAIHESLVKIAEELQTTIEERRVNNV